MESGTERRDPQPREVRAMNIELLRAGAAYLALVGLPAAALIVVLRAGAALEPPPPVGGEWVVDASRELVACMGFEHGSAVTIEQSGPYVRVHAGASYADGRMEGGRASVALRAPKGACAELAVELDFAAEDDLLAWNAHSPSCAACGPISFSTHRPAQE
jgi:hypothetical protein